MMCAHALERRLVALLAAHITDITIPGLARSTAIEDLDRMTFGQLIKEFTSVYLPSEELVEELDKMLFFRNDLAHRIADTILAAASEHEWKERIIEKLTEWALMFRETSELLRPYADQWFAKHRIDFDKCFTAILKLYPGINVEA